MDTPVPSSIHRTVDHIYQEALGLKLDLYVPDTPNGGGIIDIHGGGWFRGDKAKDADWAIDLAKVGYTVAVPNYRLAPPTYFPDPIEDIDAAMKWLETTQAISRDHMGIVGSSAGGNLSIEMAIRYGIPAVSWSGIIDIDDWLSKHPDLVAQQDTSQDMDHKESAQIDQGGPNDSFYKWFILNYLNQDETQAKAATPTHRVTSETGPLFIANSMHELVPTSGVTQLSQALLAADVPFMTKIIPGGVHAKGYFSKAEPATIAFLDEFVLGQG